MVWWWFGANMAGLRNTNAFKFILQVFILSQKHLLGVKKVVWCGLDVVWGGLEVVWGVSTDQTGQRNGENWRNNREIYVASAYLFLPVKMVGLCCYGL